MARTNEWWTSIGSDGLASIPAAFDLLAGSGLAVEGATVRRVVGALDISVEQSLSDRRPTLRTGIRVADNPPASDIDASNLNTVPWFFLAGYQVGIQQMPTGTVQQTETNERNGWLDVAVNRKLAAGDSVWWLLDFQFDESTGTRNARWFIRTLVTSPP